MHWIALGGWLEPAYRALMFAYASTADLSKAVATNKHFSQGLLCRHLLYSNWGVYAANCSPSLMRRFTSAFMEGWEMSEEQAIGLAEGIIGS